MFKLYGAFHDADANGKTQVNIRSPLFSVLPSSHDLRFNKQVQTIIFRQKMNKGIAKVVL